MGTRSLLLCEVRVRPEGCKSVVVKKLGADATEEDVRGLFKGVGAIAEARVICRRAPLTWTLNLDSNSDHTF